MNESLATFAVEIIHERIGLPVHAQLHPGPPGVLDIMPSDVHPNDSFSVRFSPGWRSAEAEFIPGKYSAPLIAQMGSSSLDNRATLAAFASVLIKRNTRLSFLVNGIAISPFDISLWPSNWNRVELRARSAPQVIEESDIAQMRQLIVELVIPVFSMVAALIGMEEPVESIEGDPEGASYQSLTTRYERKRINREACIQLKGLRCTACGFDFGDFYGSLGSGYVEIHHMTPVSQLGLDHYINVVTDLVPLCANCHAMVHRKNPPISVRELFGIVAGRKEL